MRTLPRLFLFGAAWLLAALSLMAADPVVISPENLPDGRVTLRFLAPNAQLVTLQGLSKEPQQMTKGADGVWSITVGPLAPEFYSYTFSVDGATVTDPRNRNVKKWIRSESAFEVRGEPATLGTFLDVPHGVVHRHVFFSRTRQREDAIQIYTPPGFDAKAKKKYPVLYLLHGFGDDETAWADAGRANYIADNLLAKGLTVPAVIVMTNGHPVPIPLAQRPTDYGAENTAAMERELLEEVIALVEKNYPVKTDAANRAIAGLSMGGGQSLYIGLRHLDRFGWIGGFSSGVPAGDFDTLFSSLTAAAKTKKGGPKLLWIAVGKDDFLLEPNKKFVSWLEAQHVPHTWTISDGGHQWPVWRKYLGEFLPLLFR